MKVLKSRNRLLSRPWITFIVIIALSILAYSKELLTIDLLVLFIVVLSLFNYATSIAMYHNFKYDKDFVQISNSWYPLIDARIEIKEVKKVKLTVETQIGYAVLFYFTNGKKKLYGIEAKKEDIEEMVKFIQDEIEKQS